MGNGHSRRQTVARLPVFHLRSRWHSTDPACGQPPDNQEEEQLRSEDALPPDDPLAKGALWGDRILQSARHPVPVVAAVVAVVVAVVFALPEHGWIALLERTVGVSGSSNLAHMFAESRGGIHIHSALRSSHTILAQVNSLLRRGVLSPSLSSLRRPHTTQC